MYIIHKDLEKHPCSRNKGTPAVALGSCWGWTGRLRSTIWIADYSEAVFSNTQSVPGSFSLMPRTASLRTRNPGKVWMRAQEPMPCAWFSATLKPKCYLNNSQRESMASSLAREETDCDSVPKWYFKEIFILLMKTGSIINLVHWIIM